MPTYQNDPVISKAQAHNPNFDGGVYGESTLFNGLRGVTYAPGHGSTSTTGGAGVMGEGDPGPGIIGKSTKWIGVYGETAGVENGPAGVWGEHKANGIGVKAVSKDGAGLAAYSTTNEAVHAETHSPGTAAIAAYNANPAGTGAAVFAKKDGSTGHAGFFDGNVHVTGTLTTDRNIVTQGDIFLQNADCAEDFAASGEDVEPGTVMVLGPEAILCPSGSPYDTRVAGVVSGAGEYKPAIVLDRREAPGGRVPIALMGKVYCKVDAQYGSIEVGDLLTTSSTAGHAMKIDDRQRAFGAIVGKAIGSLASGRGVIPILVTLQ